jgi:hypothetical protein
MNIVDGSCVKSQILSYSSTNQIISEYTPKPVTTNNQAVSYTPTSITNTYIPNTNSNNPS